MCEPPWVFMKSLPLCKSACLSSGSLFLTPYQITATILKLQNTGIPGENLLGLGTETPVS